jgi:glutamate N-acetyltransferase/amino-acid N-acetyltransferase
MAQLHLLSPVGFRAAGIRAGIKNRPVTDLGLLVADRPAVAAAAFTTNQVCAASVDVGRQHVAAGRLRGVVVNSGNANACNGTRGRRDALRMCALTAAAVGCHANEILPSSTGIIGWPLPMHKIAAAIPRAAKALGTDAANANDFSAAILTTDLKRKSAAVEFRLRGRRARLAGVCKGSGMIGPRLAVPQATMLAYLTTDVWIAAGMLRRLTRQAVETSFNAVTVDDHTSTNDTVCVLASGAGEGCVASTATVRVFAAALGEVCRSLAYQIAADGEGATKVVAVRVRGATSAAAAKAIARRIANSPRVKCAMYGNDPNWPRIVSAAGCAGAPFDAQRCVLTLQGRRVFAHGQPVTFDAAAASKALARPHVDVDLDCRMGNAQAVCWTCDLSKDYVTINAE